MVREPGFYHVFNYSKWTIAYWFEGFWVEIGDDSIRYDEDFEKIGSAVVSGHPIDLDN